MDKTEKVFRYLNDEMNADERSAFEEKLSLDTALRDELSLYTQMEEYISRRSFRSEGITTLRDVHQTHTPLDRKQYFKKPYWQALLFILCCIIVVWYYTSRTTTKIIPNPDQIFAEMISLPPASFTTKGFESDSALLLIQSTYNNGAYDSAIELIQTYTSANDTQKEQLLFYHAIALLAEDRYQESLTLLSNPIITRSIYQSDATWYKALVYMKLGLLDQSISELKTISQRSVYYERALTTKDMLESYNDN